MAFCGDRFFPTGFGVFLLALDVFLLSCCNLAAVLRVLLFGLCTLPRGLEAFLACLCGRCAPFVDLLVVLLSFRLSAFGFVDFTMLVIGCVSVCF